MQKEKGQPSGVAQLGDQAPRTQGAGLLIALLFVY